jgi:hypothetical protein
LRVPLLNNRRLTAPCGWPAPPPRYAKVLVFRLPEMSSPSLIRVWSQPGVR